jgi:hypothetical protein
MKVKFDIYRVLDKLLTSCKLVTYLRRSDLICMKATMNPPPVPLPLKREGVGGEFLRNK